MAVKGIDGMGFTRSLFVNWRGVLAPARRLWAHANDSALNIRTVVDRNQAAAASQRSVKRLPKCADAVAYETPDYWYVRRIGQMLAPTPESADVFYDLGSGKGRIVCVMARLPFRRVVGVELDGDLCRQAQQNAHSLRGRRAPIEIVCDNAAEADLSPGTVFFLFNPFGPATLRRVFDRLRDSVEEHPRQIRIIYYNAIHKEVLESLAWLRAYDSFETQSGLSVTFWTNRLSGEGVGQ